MFMLHTEWNIILRVLMICSSHDPVKAPPPFVTEPCDFAHGYVPAFQHRKCFYKTFN